MTRRLLLSAAILSFASIPALAQASNASDPAGFCPQGAMVIVDGRQQCREIDTLEKLIDDLEAADMAVDPYSAGSEGDREALRRLRCQLRGGPGLCGADPSFCRAP